MRHPIKFFLIVLFYTGPLSIVGILLCVSLIGIPFGILVLGLASKPLADIMEMDIKDSVELTEYDTMGNPVDKDEEKSSWNLYEPEQEVEKPWKIR